MVAPGLKALAMWRLGGGPGDKKRVYQVGELADKDLEVGTWREHTTIPSG